MSNLFGCTLIISKNSFYYCAVTNPILSSTLKFSIKENQLFSKEKLVSLKHTSKRILFLPPQSWGIHVNSNRQFAGRSMASCPAPIDLLIK